MNIQERKGFERWRARGVSLTAQTQRVEAIQSARRRHANAIVARMCGLIPLR